VVVSCGPAPDERAAATRLQRSLGPAALSTDGQTSWAQLAGLLHRARLFVGVDTAAMHLAAACGCPTVALFGGSKIFEWFPWRVRHRTVRPHDWLGTEAAEAISKDGLMGEIDADRVITACDEVLEGGGIVLPEPSRLVVAM
jgi:heptosyltransferase-3